MLTDNYMANEETFPTCGYYLYDTVEGDSVQVKKKSKVEILILTLLSPIYIIGLLIYGVFAFVQFLTQGGFFWSINIWLDYFNYLSLFLYIFAIFIQFGCVSMSVYAKGLLEKARREIETNYKETGFRETNFERHKREEKEHGR